MAPRALIRRLGLVALLSLASTGGCALVIGADFGEKTVRGSGGGGDGGDAGADAPEDAATDDGMSDTGSPDAPPSDAGPSPCATTHTFCDDFDHEDDTFAAWFGVDAPTDPTTELLEIDTKLNVSAPNSLHTRVSQSQEALSAVTQVFGGSIQSIHCEVDLRHDTLPGGEGGAPVVSLSLPQDYNVNLGLGPNSALSACSGGPCSLVQFSAPAPGVWAHFVIDLDIENGHATLALGKVGAPPVQLGMTTSAALPGYNGGVELSVGIVSKYDLTGPFDAHFDNVWCDVTP